MAHASDTEATDTCARLMIPTTMEAAIWRYIEDQRCNAELDITNVTVPASLRAFFFSLWCCEKEKDQQLHEGTGKGHGKKTSQDDPVVMIIIIIINIIYFFFFFQIEARWKRDSNKSYPSEPTNQRLWVAVTLFCFSHPSPSERANSPPPKPHQHQ